MNLLRFRSFSTSSSSFVKTFQISKENYQNKPYKVNIAEAVKWICRCGQSKKYPLCDGAHKNYHNGTITPFRADTTQLEKPIIGVCGCGYSQNALTGSPLCDGTHRKILSETATI